MCGIAGYVGPREKGRLQALERSLAHRGPDGRGSFEEGKFHLAMRRLAIVDLETGGQPKFGAGGRVAVFLNGEIYNAPELRTKLEAAGVRFESNSSDTEVIAHLFAAEGIACVDKLWGMFAIAILDRRTQELYLVRDRLGKKPLFYTHDPKKKRFAFASEFNCLKKSSRGALARASLVWYFSQKTTPQESTVDTSIKKLAPGSWLSLSRSGRLRTERWYVPGPARVHAPRGEEAVVADLDVLLTDAVRLRMRADVEVGSFLSGGLDSSLIVALASRFTRRPLKTYALVYAKNVNHKADDARYAKLVAKRYGADHREVLLTPALLQKELPKIVRHYGQPNSAVVSCWFIAREMGKRLKVALSGDGADEIFGSYRLHRDAAAGRTTGALERSLDRLAVFPDAELAKLLRPDVYKKGQILKALAARTKQLTNKSGLNRALEYDCRNLLADQVLNYGDALGMAHALEIRNPFLDHRLVDYAFSLDPKLKIKNGVTKYALRRLAAKYLPKEILTRPKEGFVEPAVYWIHKEMKPFALAHLGSKNFDRFGLLERPYVDALVDGFYKKFDFTLGKRVWNLLVYAIWEKTADAR